MQTKEGRPAAGIVGSEILAMFCLVLLPEMLSRFLALRGCEVGSKEHDDLCKAAAAAIGEPDLWWAIYYPFPISLDNDSRHHWLRSSLLQPRLSEEQAEALKAELQTAEDRAIIMLLLDKELKSWTDAGHPVSVRLKKLAFDVACAKANDAEERRAALAEIEAHLKLPFKHWKMRQLMKERPWLRIVLPHQMMPLCKCAPEIHMAVEHRVDTVKGDSGIDVWEFICSETDQDRIFDASVYQDIVCAVVERRSDDKGKAAIAGSIRKQKQCCRILAANRDHIVVLMRVSKGQTHVKVELMFGRAGSHVPGRWS